jgi:hypothetical protein
MKNDVNANNNILEIDKLSINKELDKALDKFTINPNNF